MAKKDPRIDQYIANAAPFARPILKHLRRVVHVGCPDVQETIKWKFPHFDHHGMMCGMAAFTHHCTFGFWKASLVFDKPIAQRDAMGHFGKITSLAELPNESELVALVRKAAELNEQGISEKRAPKRPRKPIPMPDYFAAALQKNAKARKTFESFSPSHQREYLEWVTEAKREETRVERLKKSIAWLSEGKTRNWKYERKSRE